MKTDLSPDTDVSLLPRADLPVIWDAFKAKAALVPVKDNKPQTTRMKKCECEECGYVARTVKKWLDAVGPPLCPCNSKVMKLDLGLEEGEGE